jgi:hypothetical protein
MTLQNIIDITTALESARAALLNPPEGPAWGDAYGKISTAQAVLEIEIESISSRIGTITMENVNV